MPKNTDGLKKGIYPGKEAEEQEEYVPPGRPEPYPLDEALEASFAPTFELPPHCKDEWEQPATVTSYGGQPAASKAVTGSQLADTGAATGAGSPASVSETPRPAQSLAPVRDAQVPESVADLLRGLPQWQARYVLALMELGGIMGLACHRIAVSRKSVMDALVESTLFARACHEAVAHSTDLVHASLFQSATVGDLEPIFRGVYLVGHKRVKSTKAAELVLRLRKELTGDKEVTVSGSVHIEQAHDDQIPAIVAAVTARLYGSNRGRPVLDAESGEQIGTTEEG